MSKRKPIRRTERLRLDRQTVLRLLEAGQIPRRRANRVLVDLNVDPGRVFRKGSLKEKWIFATVAAGRAAQASCTFDLFAKTADFANLRHYVLRPKGAKVKVADLASGIKKLSDDYNKHVGKLVGKKKLAPLVSVLHIRYDEQLDQFDLHLHCLWIVEDANLDAVLKGIQTKFSSTWMEREKIRRPAALANYIFSWVIDHRSLQKWSNEAVLAVWNLKRLKFIKPTGAFAASRRSLKNVRIVREGTEVVAVPIKRRLNRPKSKTGQPKPGSTLAYVSMKLDGKQRLCAVAAVDGQKRLTARQIRDIQDRHAASRNARAPNYSTTKTGSTPPGAGQTSETAQTHLIEDGEQQFRRSSAACNPDFCSSGDEPSQSCERRPENESPALVVVSPVHVPPDEIPLVPKADPAGIRSSIGANVTIESSVPPVNLLRKAWHRSMRLAKRLFRWLSGSSP